MNAFTIGEQIVQDKIGHGTQGDVYRAKHVNNPNKIVAIKKMKFDDGKNGNNKEGIPSTALREISLLKELNHPNIVNLLQIVNPEISALQLVFEFCDQDLKKFIVNHVKKPTELARFYMDDQTLKEFTRQMLVGLQECHKRRIIHRDLKPQNVLVDLKNSKVKLADFGLARAQGFPPRPQTHEVVTLWQRSPEILLGSQDQDGGVDIWSIGCIMVEMHQRDPLFMGDSEIDQIHKIFQCFGTPTEDTWPGVTRLAEQRQNQPQWNGNKLRNKVPQMDMQAQDLLSRMLEVNPSKRITAKDALSHPYFR